MLSPSSYFCSFFLKQYSVIFWSCFALWVNPISNNQIDINGTLLTWWQCLMKLPTLFNYRSSCNVLGIHFINFYIFMIKHILCTSFCSHWECWQQNICDIYTCYIRPRSWSVPTGPRFLPDDKHSLLFKYWINNLESSQCMFSLEIWDLYCFRWQ